MKQKAFDNQRITDKAYVSNLECKYVILPGKYVFFANFTFLSSCQAPRFV